ncbi:hypothetical protein [Erythrobacter alti]|uniref:hypothetical protein n=1 Tax=Erythrobacter alti TaxID=1896145 RepID=UPI0030F4B02B
MTDLSETQLSGESRLKARRRKFWRYFMIAMVMSAGAGMLSGIASSMYEDGELPLWVPVSATIVIIAGLSWFTWDYFRRIDEIDLQDNLWANTFGAYAGVITYLGWWFFADLGLVTQPTALGIILVMFVTTMAVYGLRKLNFR